MDEKLDYDPMKDPTFDPIEAERTRGVSGKNNPKGGKKLKKLTKEEVGISSSAAMKKAREEAKLQKKEAEAVKKVKKEEVNPIVARNDRLNKERAMKAAKEREAKKPSADVIAARKRQLSG